MSDTLAPGAITRNGRPEGVVVERLTPHRDSRGTFLELFRETWRLGCRPIQWNAVTSGPGVLRGVHVHVRHDDLLVLVGGRMLIGLHDLRPWSPTFRASELLEVEAAAPQAVIVPVGVAHGLYFPEASLLVYGASEYFDPRDELACRWNAPSLGLPWPTTSPILSERDATSGDYASFLQDFRRAWSLAHEAAGTPECRSA
jgi:dTDP-4-dehydrorhamnose 3,5-epimerase